MSVNLSKRVFAFLGLAALPILAVGTPQTPYGVVVINPSAVTPSVGPPPFNAGGPAVSRGIVSQKAGASAHMSISYNTYKKGTVLAVPYSYNVDELCYLPSGHVRMENEDRTIETGAGELMWRPAGAVTRRAEALQDTVSICLMTRAGRASGATPFPKYFRAKDAPVLESRTGKRSDGLVQREVLSTRKDGVAVVSVVYTSLGATSSIAFDKSKETACWVESGALEIWSSGEKKLAQRGSIFFKPEGVEIERTLAKTATDLVCFDSPASI